MCIKLSGGSKPGDLLTVFKKGGGISFMRWGFNKGEIYNARWDKLSTTWKKFDQNRGYIKVRGFFEKNQAFFHIGDKLLTIGVIYSPAEECAIITVDANIVVMPYHERMPLVLGHNATSDFLEGSHDIKPLGETMFYTRKQLVA